MEFVNVYRRFQILIANVERICFYEMEFAGIVILTVRNVIMVIVLRVMMDFINKTVNVINVRVLA